MKIIFTIAFALMASVAFAEKSRVYPNCELVDKGGYYNLAPAGCSRVNWSNERDDSPTFEDHFVGSPAWEQINEKFRKQRGL